MAFSLYSEYEYSSNFPLISSKVSQASRISNMEIHQKFQHLRINRKQQKTSYVQDTSSCDSSEAENVADYRVGGYHRVEAGDLFGGGRYRILRKLGWGHFSVVWLAFDMTLMKLCAIKIQKSARHYSEAAYDEIELLRLLQNDKEQMQRHVVEFYDHFTISGPHGTHMCLTFEVMSKSLLSLIRHYNNRGIPIPLLKRITKQILEALCYIHDTCNIIHTDLKPENILFVTDSDEETRMKGMAQHILIEREVRLRRKVETIGEYLRGMTSVFKQRGDCTFTSEHVKIVDFGNACIANQQVTKDIQTRQYRAPEVILGYGYTTKVDMWSVACIVFELATGDVLFDPREGKTYSRDEDHIGLMMELLGPVPKKMRYHGLFGRDFFDRNGNLRSIPRLSFWGIRDILYEKYRFTRSQADDLAQFLLPMLNFDPSRRVSARGYVNHPYLMTDIGMSRCTTESDVEADSKRAFCDNLSERSNSKTSADVDTIFTKARS